MASENSDRQALERYAGVLTDQADRLLRKLDVDVSKAKAHSQGSSAFRQSADAYERLALAEPPTADRVAWERTVVDGRNGAEIMRRLWEVRQELRRQDEFSAQGSVGHS